MAKISKKTDVKSKTLSASKVEWNFPLHKKNMMILLLGLGVIILGYLAMSTGLGSQYAVPEGDWNSPIAIVVGPALLVFAYLVIIPYGILKKFDNNQENSQVENNDK